MQGACDNLPLALIAGVEIFEPRMFRYGHNFAGVRRNKARVCLKLKQYIEKMARIVKKFGGTSVGDMDRIRNVAKTVAKAVANGDEIVVVLSAMSGTTNSLVEFCREASPMHDAREYDTVVAAGEQITVGLMSICLQDLGVPARSFLGWQVPIRTNDVHGAARIETIETEALEDCLKGGRVAVVAGFQGLGQNNRITTLGRGGSDTSAVAIAAAIKADRCDIYTDVDGVYTTDPRIVPKARKLDKITYEEMLEMASLGAKVLQTRSVALAMKYGVRTQVRSSFEDTPGTLVVNEDEIVEQEVVSGIAYSRGEAKITIVGLEDRPGQVSHVFAPLAEENINVDMIVQSASEDGTATDVTFTVPEDHPAEYLGFPNQSPQQLARQVVQFHCAGRQTAIHANGDAAIDMAIAAHELAAADDLSADRRTVLIHSQFVRDDQLKKYAEYNLIPALYTEHTFFFSATHIANRGLEQASRISPMRDAIDLGLKPTNHTDFNVAPIDQMLVLWSAVNRVGRDGKVVGPE
ncbi:MAG: aspartate kinase, partial [Kordiimonadales bacterium]